MSAFTHVYFQVSKSMLNLRLSHPYMPPTSVQFQQTQTSQSGVTNLPQKAVVAKRLLSRGGAHLAQIPWQAGYDTP